MNDDDERAAREWLDGAENDMRLGADFRRAKYTVSDNWKHRATILRMLDRPVLPRGEDVPDDVLRAMGEALAIYGDDDVVREMRAAIDVLHAHLTAPPKPKKVERWAVVWPDGSVSTHADEVKARRDMGTISGSRVVKLIEAVDD